jgi:hypothetical protein
MNKGKVLSNLILRGGRAMKKKNLLIIIVILVSITTYFVVSRIIPNIYNINNKSRVQIENTVSLYLMNNEKFSYDIPKEIEVKFDKSSNFYIATVSFENTTKKANIFISADNDVMRATIKER